MTARALVLDALGTLFGLESLDERLATIGAPPGTRDAWFARTLDTARCLTIVDDFVPFQDVATAALRTTLAIRELDPTRADEVVAGLRELDPVSGGREALESAGERGLARVVLSNGGRESTLALLERAGLGELVDEVVGCDELRRYKPHPSTYHEAASRAGVDPGETTLVTAHGWDAAGARAAGLEAVWIDRQERVWPLPVPPAPSASTLGEAVARAAA